MRRLRHRAAAAVVAAAATALPLPSALAADWGLSLDAGLWQPDYQGALQDGDTLLLREDLGLSSDTQGIFALQAHSPVAWLPELALQYTRLKADGSRQADRSLSLGDIVLLPGSSQLDTRLDVDDFMATLRWRLPLGPLTLSPGVTLRHLEGDVRVVETRALTTTTLDVDAAESFPMAHLGLALDWRPLRLEAAGNYAEADDERIYDLRVALWAQPRRWTGPLRAGVAWQLRRYDFDDGTTRVNARLDGFQFLLGLRW